MGRISSFSLFYETDPDAVPYREFEISGEVEAGTPPTIRMDPDDSDPGDPGELNVLEIVESQGPDAGKYYTQDEFKALTGKSAFDLAYAKVRR